MYTDEFFYILYTADKSANTSYTKSEGAAGEPGESGVNSEKKKKELLEKGRKLIRIHVLHQSLPNEGKSKLRQSEKVISCGMLCL